MSKEGNVEQFTLGFLPTDISYNLAIMIDENRGYFIISCNFQMTETTKPESPGVSLPPEVISTSQVEV